MTARAPSQAALARAAKVAAQEGVCIVIEVDGVAYRIVPVEKPAESAQDRRTPEPWT